MQALALFLLSVLAACRADTLSQLESYCIRECGTPEYDQLVEELDHQDELLNEVATKAMNLEHKLDEWKHELEEADKESKNMLLRLDRLHSDKEEAVCPKKHFKCLKGDSKRHEKCISDILVCDGEPDCLDGSDEDENLCKFPVPLGVRWGGHFVYYHCVFTEGTSLYQDIVFDNLEHSDHMKSNIKAHATVYWNFRDEEVRSLGWPVKYNFAHRKGIGKFLFRGSHFYFEYNFMDDAVFATIHRQSTGQECGAIVYTSDYKQTKLTI